jgi:hypothetical protein
VEFSCGCSAFQFPSFYCWRCVLITRETAVENRPVSTESHVGSIVAPVAPTASAVSWAAIIAGSVVAAATTLLLSILATGIDLASVSPWPSKGVTATSAAVMTAIGLIVIQWVSALLGGYITGRLRTKWVGTHTHEVFFRDTAHGFIMWALSTVLVFSALASAGSVLVGATVHGASVGAAAGVTSGASSGKAPAGQAGQVAPYELDRLLRSAAPASHPEAGNDARTQVGRILSQGLLTGAVNADDRTYMAQLVSAQAGISADEAQRRVDDAIAKVKAADLKAREAADTARKSASLASVLAALSMLVGAFIASVSAALGGRLRDLHP